MVVGEGLQQGHLTGKGVPGKSLISWGGGGCAGEG